MGNTNTWLISSWSTMMAGSGPYPYCHGNLLCVCKRSHRGSVKKNELLMAEIVQPGQILLEHPMSRRLCKCRQRQPWTEVKHNQENIISLSPLKCGFQRAGVGCSPLLQLQTLGQCLALQHFINALECMGFPRIGHELQTKGSCCWNFVMVNFVKEVFQEECWTEHTYELLLLLTHKCYFCLII